MQERTDGPAELEAHPIFRDLRIRKIEKNRKARQNQRENKQKKETKDNDIGT